MSKWMEGSSMNGGTSSMDESVICGCHPWMEVASMDESVIDGCHPWMEKPNPWMTSTDEDDR